MKRTNNSKNIIRNIFFLVVLTAILLFSGFLLKQYLFLQRNGQFSSDDFLNIEKKLSQLHPLLHIYQKKPTSNYFNTNQENLSFFKYFIFNLFNIAIFSWNQFTYVNKIPVVLNYISNEFNSVTNLIYENYAQYRYSNVPKYFRYKMNLFDKNSYVLSNSNDINLSSLNGKIPIFNDKSYILHYTFKKSNINQDNHENTLEFVRSIISTKDHPSMGSHMNIVNGATLDKLCNHNLLECRFMEWNKQEKMELFSRYQYSKLNTDLVFLFNQENESLQKIVEKYNLSAHDNRITVTYTDETLRNTITNELLSLDNVYQASYSLRKLNQFNNYAANKILLKNSSLFINANTMESFVKLEDTSISQSSSHIWEIGIRGKNQTVGIGDTGIDFDNCFFIDTINRSNLVPNIPQPSHRKIIYYKKMKIVDNGRTYESDGQDVVGGHGTHTSGSIAGSIHPYHPNFKNLSRYNGMAPDAKLFLQDIHSPSLPFLLIPDNLHNYFFEPYQYGARIHSNSWGCDFSSQIICSMDCNCEWSPTNQMGKTPYTSVDNSYCISQFGRRCCEVCSVYDQQAQDVDKFLNNYDEMTILFSSGNNGQASYESNLGTPAVSKNSIAVGASLTSNEGFIDSISRTDFIAIMNELRLITGGVLNFANTDQCCAYSGIEKDTVKFYCCPSYIKQVYESKNIVYSEINLAPFSSKGPTPTDKRYGVDVVAPGMVVSSTFSDGNLNSNNCGGYSPNKSNNAAIIKKEGTSMSCPLVAGTAALVRDYYESGFYPTGIRNSRNRISDLSGMLVKATIIHSAQPLSGMIYLGEFTKPIPKQYPNSDVGFGIVELNSVLKLKNSSFNLFIINRKQIEQGERHPICFKSYNNNTIQGEFRATLVWYDKEGPLDGDFAIINDLELNAWSKIDGNYKYYPGNNNNYHDSVNTVEQIRIPMHGFEEGIVVTVEGIQQDTKQNYALVITYNKNLYIVNNCYVPDRPSVPFEFKTFIFISILVSGSLFFTLSTFIIISLILVSLVKISRGKVSQSQNNNNNQDNQDIELDLDEQNID